jgi:TPR repeat protein
VILAFYMDDPASAVPLLTAAADAADPVAQRSLGFLVQRGLGTEPDLARASQLYRSAAEGGDAIAAYNVALTYVDSEDGLQECVRWARVAALAGVTEAYPLLAKKLAKFDQRDADGEALAWCVKGAEDGHVGCMFVAARRYRDGFGGPVDLVQSLRWFIAMLNAGNGDGLHEAHGVVPHMTPAQIREAAVLAGRPSVGETFISMAAPTNGAVDAD